jgi:hypothetical protein
VNPVKNTSIISQGTVPAQNIVFRCPFYPKSFSGFAGRTLTPENIIENSNTVSAACNLLVGIHEKMGGETIQISPNPAADYITISGISGETKIFNSVGIEMWSGNTYNKQKINITAFQNGLYFVRNNNFVNKFLIIK